MCIFICNKKKKRRWYDGPRIDRQATTHLCFVLSVKKRNGVGRRTWWMSLTKEEAKGLWWSVRRIIEQRVSVIEKLYYTYVLFIIHIHNYTKFLYGIKNRLLGHLWSANHNGKRFINSSSVTLSLKLVSKRGTGW